ncbi:hypothetical protein [Armatimonas sp.]|uniref:hypothetical protein n=1 Tax=Armatimonas sp. TaxID=1872638 RepID=UPI00286B097B|nr:hypothetical protein [Armatimonas sp.]
MKFLNNVDRRLLYLLLIVVIAIPLLAPAVTKGLPKPAITAATRSYYETIEKVASDPAAKNKIVIVACNFAAGTLAENLSQCEATVRHLMMRKVKFAIFGFSDPQGRELGQQAVEKLAKEYDYQYGRDYVNWGYRPAGAATALIKAAVNDLPGALGKDIKGMALGEVACMQGIKGVNDVSIIIEIASANTIPVWIQFYQRAGKTPIPTLYCPTSVMATEAIPMLETGQLQGMLTGLKGASEYELLLEKAGFATSASASLSLSHLLILVLIFLGNLGMFLERKQRAAAEGGR